MSQTQWKQFVQLYGEKNKHLTKQQVLQQAKKPFQQLKKKYQQKGGSQLEDLIELIDENYNEIYRIHLHGEHINTENAEIIANAVLMTNSVRSFTLVSCDMDKEAKDLLFDALTGSRSIKYLCLENCMLKDADFTELADVLSVNNIIDVVNLTDNNTSGNGVAAAAVEKIRADHPGRIIDY
jgi:hypothetical protein